MYLPVLLGLLSFVLCFVLTPVCRVMATRLGLVDKPDGTRKRHNVAVPRVGGFVIVFSYAGTLAVFLFADPLGQLHIQHSALLRVLLPPAALIFLVGLCDDLFTLSPRHKLFGQLIACLATAFLGRMYAPQSFTFGSEGTWIQAHGWVSILICTGWLVLCTNAINLIDGLDGLASGVGLLGTAATMLIGITTHNVGLVVATAPLAGALLAFLYYNFNPASIFLGDCGSLTIGFMLGAISLTWQRHGGVTLGMFGPITILALPLLDVCIAIVRRYLRRKPLFSADRGHIHHVVQDRGNQPKAAVAILYAGCALAATLSVLSSVAPRGVRMLLIVAFAVLLMFAVRYLDYIEFRSLARVLSSRRMRQQVDEEIYLRDLEILLSQVKTMEDCWTLIQRVCAELHFATVEMLFKDLHFDAVLRDEVDQRDWWLTLPIGEHGYLRISRSNLLRVGTLTMPALDHLQRALDRWERTSFDKHQQLKAPVLRPMERVRLRRL